MGSNFHRVRIPSFSGFSEIERFWDWVERVDEFFEWYEVEWDIQALLVARKFKGCMVYWWEWFQNQRIYCGKKKIRSWPKMRMKLVEEFYQFHEEEDEDTKIWAVEQYSREDDEIWGWDESSNGSDIFLQSTTEHGKNDEQEVVEEDGEIDETVGEQDGLKVEKSEKVEDENVKTGVKEDVGYVIEEGSVVNGEDANEKTLQLDASCWLGEKTADHVDEENVGIEPATAPHHFCKPHEEKGNLIANFNLVRPIPCCAFPNPMHQLQPTSILIQMGHALLLIHRPKFPPIQYSLSNLIPAHLQHNFILNNFVFDPIIPKPPRSGLLSKQISQLMSKPSQPPFQFCLHFLSSHFSPISKMTSLGPSTPFPPKLNFSLDLLTPFPPKTNLTFVFYDPFLVDPIKKNENFSIYFPAFNFKRRVQRHLSPWILLFASFLWSITLVPLWIWEEVRRAFSIGVFFSSPGPNSRSSSFFLVW